MSTGGDDRLRIVAVDPGDEARFAAWYRVYADAERHGRTSPATVWQPEEVRVLLAEPSIRHRSAGWAGLLDGETVAAGYLEAPLLDNTERVELAVHVLPEHRRRGHGSAMLRHLEEQARAWGRTVLGGEAAFDHDRGPDGAGVSGPEFARARGYTLALGELERLLRMPVPDGLLDRLAAQAAPHHTAYTLRWWVGPVPEELLAGWAALTATLAVQAPTGSLALEEESADPAAVRDGEAVLAKQGRTKYNAVALAPDGALVAYSDLATTVHEPRRAYQWGTLVRPDHRGHRLGLAIKVALLRLLAREQPEITEVVTYNAEENAPMVAVNDRLGFVPTARLAEFQRRL